MKIAVIGAGLAGLATASFLRRDGHEVTVFERDAELKGRGVGIIVQPLGMAVLKQLGVADEVLAEGSRIDRLHLEKIKKNKTVYDLAYKDAEPGTFGVGIHRPRLYDILLGNARKLGVNFVSGCSIQDAVVNGDQRQLLDSANNDRGSFDLVVDSSGYRSPLRQKYAAISRQENYTEGVVCFTTEDDKSLSHSFNNASRIYYQGKHSMTAIPSGKNPVTGKDLTSFFWGMPVDKFATFNLGAWKKEVTALMPGMKNYLAQITSQDQIVLARYADVALKTYNTDKLVFVGDSAHSTSPLLGQSSTMGFADAFVLSKVLQREPDLKKALPTYSAERKDHIKFQQDNSRTLTRIFMSVAPLTRFIGDVVIPKTLWIPGMRKLWTMMAARAEKNLKKSVLRQKYGI